VVSKKDRIADNTAKSRYEIWKKFESFPLGIPKINEKRMSLKS
jgi:hypothetical protein